MKHSQLLFTLLSLIICLGTAGAGQQNALPHLRKQGTASQLIVDNRPFLVLAGELGNSSSSSLAYTVVMVQVENEIGMIPDSRDRSAAANQLWNDPVPSELMSYLQQRKEELIPEFRAFWAANGFKAKGTWQEVFGSGPQSEEVFMAWYFARYTNQVTDAGKKEYSLPMFVNAALTRPGYQPGQYPSAGPLPHLIDVWRAGAPQIDFLAPDIYFQNFAEWTRRYQRSGNPLFIPEAMAVPAASVNALYAIGQHDAIGFSPFSIESLDEDTGKAVAASYQLLSQMAPLILEKQGRAMMAGLLPEDPEQRLPQQLRLGDYVMNVTYERPSNPASTILSGGLVISFGPNEFVFAGTNLTVTFETDSRTDPIAGLLSVEEGKFVDGQWQTLRRLNGDQTHQGRHIRLPAGRFGIQRVKLYRYH